MRGAKLQVWLAIFITFTLVFGALFVPENSLEHTYENTHVKILENTTENTLEHTYENTLAKTTPSLRKVEREDAVSLWEVFVPESGCDGSQSAERSDWDAILNWRMGEGSSLAGRQRADALGASECSVWLNGDLTENQTTIYSQVDLRLSVEKIMDGDEIGLHLEAEINLDEEVSETMNLRWFITVDRIKSGQNNVDDIVMNYGWSASFNRSLTDSQQWQQFIDEEQLISDEIPSDDNELWRIEVTIVMMDDLNQSIIGIDTIQLESPSIVPDVGGMGPTIILGILIACGLLAIVFQDYKREVGIPRLKGVIIFENANPVAKVTIDAGKFDATLKGVKAERPWRVSRSPSDQLITAGTSREFLVKLRGGNDESTEVELRWEIDVDELGGWVLDLKLPYKTN